MSKTVYVLLALLLCSILPVAVVAAGKRPADVWNYYHFDGNAFASGASSDGSPYLAVREKVQPVVVTSQATTVEQSSLSEGTGAIAGICYQQSSSGKLGVGSRFKPCFRATLLISAGSKQLLTIQTDDNGYFVVVLPAGKYSIGSGSIKAEINVERGITTLIPLRAGKRMVD